ncbi:MAG: STAS domain-containing protein, partial [Solirubrobacteraceae bacterium]
VMSCGSLPTGDEFAVLSERRREHLVLALFGELDLATAPALEQQLEAVWASDAPALVLDLEGLAFIDSTGLRLILHAQRRALAEEKGFSLRRLPRQAQRVFEVVGLTGRVPVDR